MPNNPIQPVLIIGSIVLIALTLYWFFFVKPNTEVEEYVDEDAASSATQRIAEYRTYLINQFVSLCGFWLDAKFDESNTKFTCPGFNQNTLYCFVDNLEIYAFFDWNKDSLIVKTSVYTEKGYIIHKQNFSLATKDLPDAALYKLVKQAQKEHDGLYSLSADEAMSIIKQLRLMKLSFEDEEQSKRVLFQMAADLMMTMRNEKNLRNNKELMLTYSTFIHWFWSVYEEEFLQFLNEDEETEGNE